MHCFSSNASNVSVGSDMVMSTLTVIPLLKRHSGNYTCSVGSLAFTTVAVHVLNGKNFVESSALKILILGIFVYSRELYHNLYLKSINPHLVPNVLLLRFP